VVDVAPNLGWRDVPLAEMARQALRLRVPVGVHNEANLGAVAEHARGAGADLDDFVYVSSEVGLGAGIITGGRLLQGADGYAGEVGHLPVNPSGLVCACGARDCWETEVAEQAMLRARGLPVDGGAESLDVLFRRAELGNPHMLRALQEVGAWLGLGFVTLVNVFNPRKIVLGGVLARAFPFVAGVAEETIRRRCRLPAGEPVRLTPSPLGEHVVLYGAAEVAFEDVLSDPGALEEFDASSAPTLPEPLSVAATSPIEPAGLRTP
jgi:predicted NBD/HSP70 family sugar kinase